MYKIDEVSIKKLIELNNLLNKLEIRGISNVEITYSCMIRIQEIMQKIEELNKTEQGIVVNNNTKGE